MIPVYFNRLCCSYQPKTRRVSYSSGFLKCRIPAPSSLRFNVSAFIAAIKFGDARLKSPLFAVYKSSVATFLSSLIIFPCQLSILWVFSDWLDARPFNICWGNPAFLFLCLFGWGDSVKEYKAYRSKHRCFSHSPDPKRMIYSNEKRTREKLRQYLRVIEYSGYIISGSFYKCWCVDLKLYPPRQWGWE